MTVRNGSYIGDIAPYFLWPRSRIGQIIVGTQIAVIGQKPIVTIITSLPPVSATTPVLFTVVGNTGVPIRRAWADLVLPGIVGTEVIHNGDRFGAYYTNGTNTRVSITNGYLYTVLRDGGWPVGSFPLVSSFEISAVDTVGGGT